MVGERTGEMDIKGYDLVIDVAKKDTKAVPPDSLTGLVVRALVSRREWGADERRIALDCFKSFDSVRLKRAVIDGMTAHPHEDFIEPLLAFAKTIPADDTHMKHATRVALRNCLEVSATTPFKVTIAKDATPADHRPLLDSLLGCTDQKLVANLVDLLKARLVPEDRAFDTGRRVGRYASSTAWREIGEAAAAVRGEDVPSIWLRTLAGTFRGVQESGYKYPRDGTDKSVAYSLLLTNALKLARAGAMSANSSVPQQALEVYREARNTVAPDKLPSGVEGSTLLADALMSPTATPDQRVLAAEVVLLYGLKGGKQSVQQIVQDEVTNSSTQLRLVGLLLSSNPTASDCALGTSALKTAPYTQAVQLAVPLASDKFGADLLLASIGKGESPARLLQEKAVTDRLKATGVKDLDAKLKELTKNIPPAEKRVEDLLKARTAGFPKAKTDVAKGKAVFTKQCAICHQLNNEGAKVGPQLDGVGIRGAARLMEDTLDPNRNVDHTFRATKLDLKDGQSLTGLVREDGAVYVLVDSAGKEHRVPTADVDKKTTSHLSAMPANLDTTMTEEEYYNLLAFLLEQKPKK
jgi:putative heme-binding domain-containing protein